MPACLPLPGRHLGGSWASVCPDSCCPWFPSVWAMPSPNGYSLECSQLPPDLCLQGLEQEYPPRPTAHIPKHGEVLIFWPWQLGLHGVQMKAGSACRILGSWVVLSRVGWPVGEPVTQPQSAPFFCSSLHLDHMSEFRVPASKFSLLVIQISFLMTVGYWFWFCKTASRSVHVHTSGPGQAALFLQPKLHRPSGSNCTPPGFLLRDLDTGSEPAVGVGVGVESFGQGTWGPQHLGQCLKGKVWGLSGNTRWPWDSTPWGGELPEEGWHGFPRICSSLRVLQVRPMV